MDEDYLTVSGYERFLGSKKSYAPKISIRKRGQIGFNNGIVKRFNLKIFKFVALYFNYELFRIAFKFTNDSSEEGLVAFNKRENNNFVSAKSFLDFHEVDYSENRTFRAEWFEDESTLLIKDPVK